MGLGSVVKGHRSDCGLWFVLSLRRHDPDQVPDRLNDQGFGKAISVARDTPWN